VRSTTVRSTTVRSRTADSIVLADLVRRRLTPCAGVAAALPAHVAGEIPLDARTEEHVAQCLRCQAEIVRYRRMLRALHDLRDDVPDPPTTALADILARLGTDEPAGWTLVAVVTVVALVAGTGSAGIVVWLTSRHRGAPSPT
jgi:anti-sigma factor RsiW